jgi:hypothetical protein
MHYIPTHDGNQRQYRAPKRVVSISKTAMPDGIFEFKCEFFPLFEACVPLIGFIAMRLLLLIIDYMVYQKLVNASGE